MCPAHPTPKVRQKKPGIIRVSGQLPLHQGNKANGLDGINDKFVAPTTDPFEKLMFFADRQHQHAAFIQLRQQRGRYFRRRGGHDNGVKRRARLPTLPPIAMTG